MEVHNAEMQRTQLIRDSCDILQCEHSSTDINFGFHYILSGIYCSISFAFTANQQYECKQAKSQSTFDVLCWPGPAGLEQALKTCSPSKLHPLLRQRQAIKAEGIKLQEEAAVSNEGSSSFARQPYSPGRSPCKL